MNKQIDEAKLKEIIQYLNSPTIKAIDRDISYDQKVYDLLYSLDIDENYINNYAQIEDKEIDQLSLDDLKTIYTFICRGERFCVGHINGYILDGTLLKLANQHLKLIQKIIK